MVTDSWYTGAWQLQMQSLSGGKNAYPRPLENFTNKLSREKCSTKSKINQHNKETKCNEQSLIEKPAQTSPKDLKCQKEIFNDNYV